MASMGPTPARGGRKALDASVHLVPFIDLLSCCIAFLLITAVWSQVASVEAPLTGASHEEAPPGAPPWSVFLDGKRCELWSPDGRHEEVAAAAVGTTLRARGAGEDVILHASDGTDVDQLVFTMDRLHAAGIPRVAIANDPG
jgi:biopolymer transport protein ExbD